MAGLKFMLSDTKCDFRLKGSATAFYIKIVYSKTCLKRPLKRKTNIGFLYRLSLNAGQKYCRMFQWEHSAILSTFIKLPFAIMIFVLSILEWPLTTGFTVTAPNLVLVLPFYSDLHYILRIYVIVFYSFCGCIDLEITTEIAGAHFDCKHLQH